MKKLRVILIVVILSLLPIHCRLSLNSYTHEAVAISNVQTKQNFTLQSNPKHKNVWNIHLKITGELNGKAKIYLGYNNGKVMYEFEIPKGKVDMEKYSDWYDKECIVTYEPVDCTEGSIKIEYDFGSD